MNKIFNIKDTCTGCGACVNICAKNALSLEYDNEGFYYPSLCTEKCVECGMCEKVCPVLNETLSTKIPCIEAYMLKSIDKDVIFKSTSGGAFTIFANYILKMGGIVFASRYNYETNKLEVSNSDKYPISDFRKSKYMESFVGKSFFYIKKELQTGRKVLFVGTPCEAKGLKAYIPSKLQDKLIIVDFVCHGVPSNKHHTEYKLWLEKRIKKKIVYLDFRPKDFGWGKIFYHYRTNSEEKFIPGHDSYFYHAFQHSYFLRRSCYTCNRSTFSEADITIGDFWGIKKYDPQRADKEGISVCICRNAKGVTFLKSLDDVENNIVQLPLNNTLLILM